jgi:hypothetical protein
MPYSIFILFTCTLLHTKINVLPIDISFYLYTFYTRGAIYSRSMFNVLFIHSNHRRMKSKGHLYIYIHHSGIQKNHFHTNL